MSRHCVKLLASTRLLHHRIRAYAPAGTRGLSRAREDPVDPPESAVFSARHDASFTAATIPKHLLPVVDVDGAERAMFYADSGESASHTTTVPLMLIPGSAQTITSWGPHVKALSKWRRLIIPEFRCQGVTTTLRSRYSSMAQLVQDLDRLVEHLGVQQVDLCGFSLGGRIALAYGASEENRVRRISVTGVPLVRPPLGRTIIRSWSEGLEHEDMVASCWSFLINGYSTKFLQLNQAHLSKFVAAVVKSNDVHRLKELFRFSIAEHQEDHNSTTSCASRLSCPVQVVGGTEDRLCDIQSIIALHESIPDSYLSVVADTGHLVPFEQPAQWRHHLLSFLDA